MYVSRISENMLFVRARRSSFGDDKTDCCRMVQRVKEFDYSWALRDIMFGPTDTIWGLLLINTFGEKMG